MRFAALLLAAALALLPMFDLRAQALAVGEIGSECAVLMDADTGQILFEINMNKKAYPASTTKIMTGIVAVENSYPGELVTVSAHAVDIAEPASSNIGLIAGEELTLDDAMFAMMMPSANDAANAIAEHVAGNQERFAELMNIKAKRIGAADTHFANAHGLHEDDHYTTAYDMALITRYAAGSAMFMRYFGADRHVMPATNKRLSERSFVNYQYMMVDTSGFYNPDVIGGKVGYTTPARHTMSTVARRDGRTLICVVMGSPDRNQKFYDTQKLLDFGFNEFTPYKVSRDDFDTVTVPVRDHGALVSNVEFSLRSDLTVLLHNSADPSKVRVYCDAPEQFTPSDRFRAAVMVVADSEGEDEPSILANVPLAAWETAVEALPVMANADAAERADHFPVAVPILIGGCAALAALRVVVVRVKRKVKLIRLNRKLRGERVRASAKSHPRKSGIVFSWR